MADTPIIFKRTKSKVTQRSREAPPPEDVVDADEDEFSPSVLASKVRNKAKQRVKSKPKSTLSFGGEEDSGGEAFKIKKSHLSRKITLGQRPASPGNIPTNFDQATISSRGPVYDKAYLSELKASTPTSRSPLPPGPGTYDADISMDIDSVGDITMESLDVFDTTETVIPSESSVQATKERRETLRKIGSSAEDFISLSVIKRSEEYQGPHPESRLVREEDELGEGDDEFAEYTSAKTRIALGKKARKVEASKRRDEMQELIADAEEVDEETDEWEQEQVRRGGFQPDDTANAPVKQTYKPAPIPPITTIPTLDSAVELLSQRMTALITSHAKNTTSMTNLAQEQEKLDEREDELRDIIAKAESKRSWFAAFRDWIENVATFLDEKFPQLEALEAEHVSILKERRDMVRQRRLADDGDDLSLFLGSLPVPPHTEPEELDELGRIVPRANPGAARRDRQAARVSRRSARHKRKTRPSQEEEGYSTDATLPPSDGADYQAALRDLAKRRDGILSDVKAKEFRDPSSGIAVRFAQWRERFGDSYTGAWGGLGLVGAWEFWVRLEMLGWNPFEDSRSLDSFGWYAELHKYSRPRRPEDAGEDDEEPELGPDGDLVSAMISTTVLPRLGKMIESGALDPYSGSDIRRVIDLAEEIEISVERSNMKFQILMKAVIYTFREALDSLADSQKQYLTLNSPPFSPDGPPARRRLLARQRKLTSNLARWRKYSGALFGIDELLIVLVRDCMLPIADSGWEVGGEESMRETVKILPKDVLPLQLTLRLNV